MLPNISTLTKDGVTYFTPKSIAEVQELVRYGIKNKKEVRTRGAGHSVHEAIPPDPTADNSNIYMLVSYLNQVTIDKPSMRVTAGAGAHLGYFEYEPTGNSTPQNSVCQQLDDAGLAFPDTGGIIHQTIGGFISTGSSGSGRDDSFNEQLYSITIVTGQNDAEVVTFTRPYDGNPNDPFYAAGVCLGLFGVIVEATFDVVPNYKIQGVETTTLTSDCETDFFGDGSASRPSLRKFFDQTEYKRIIWWPQPHVDKAIVWKAEKVKPGAPYKQVPYVELTGFQQFALHLIYNVIGWWPEVAKLLSFNNPNVYKDFYRSFSKIFYQNQFPILAQIFLPMSKKVNGKYQGTPFADDWFHALPMDNGVDDKLVPVVFTELWIDIKYTKEVMNTMKEVFAKYYDPNNKNSAGPEGDFSTEIYTARPSKYWISAAYKREVIRIDVFCFADLTPEDARNFYQQFWTALEKYDYRPHWGKYFEPAKTELWRKRYEKWDDFLALRKKYDPEEIFLNKFWKAALDIQ